MNHTKSLLALGLVVMSIASGCASREHSVAPKNTTTQSEPIRNTHEGLNSTLWVQTAAEYHVDSISKYTLAKATLIKALSINSWTAALEQTNDFANLPPAVIMDLDETVLDNSRFQGELAKRHTSYSEALWTEWTNKSEADAVPGALDFIQFAQSKGVKVIFITNRTAAQENATRTNLTERLKISLPTNEDTILSKGEQPDWGSDKTSRRLFVSSKYRILMLCGDDLGDFVSKARSSTDERLKIAESNISYWGERWTLIMNPGYGSWESAMYGHDFTKPDETVLRDKWSKVRGF